MLLSSRRRNKVLLIVTDGDWAGDVPACHQMIRDLREAGVQTALAYLTTNPRGKAPDAEAVRHECEMVEVLDVTKLPRWAAEVVSRSMEKKNRRA